MAKRKQVKKLITIKSACEAKFKFLHSNIHRLTFNELLWLSRLEDFYLKHNYLSEKQINVITSMVKRHDSVND